MARFFKKKLRCELNIVTRLDNLMEVLGKKIYDTRSLIFGDF